MDQPGAPFADPAFVHLQREIAIHGPAIDAALDTGLSQGLVEAPYLPICARISVPERSLFVSRGLLLVAFARVGWCP